MLRAVTAPQFTPSPVRPSSKAPHDSSCPWSWVKCHHHADSLTHDSHFAQIVTAKFFPDEFSLMVMMQTSKPPKGFLFAVVNSLETVIQFGVKVSTTLNNNLNISLVYNDPTVKTASESLVSFSLPYDLDLWIKFEIQVTNDKIALYHDCKKVHEVNVTKDPKELVFESASTFYLAQAGKLEQKFEVSVPRNSKVFFLLKFVIECSQHLAKTCGKSGKLDRDEKFVSNFLGNCLIVRGCGWKIMSQLCGGVCSSRCQLDMFEFKDFSAIYNISNFRKHHSYTSSWANTRGWKRKERDIVRILELPDSYAIYTIY